MINEKSQRELAREDGSCPEGCFYCPGVGLDRPPADHLGAKEIQQSCLKWPLLTLDRLRETPPKSRRWFFPSKWLQGHLWRRLICKIPPQSEIIILLGEDDFNLEAFHALKKRFSVQIWTIPHRRFNPLKVLRALPESTHGFIYFYCPLYEMHPDRFLKSQELAKLFRKIRKALPNFSIRPPEGVEVFNPTLRLEDLNQVEEVKWSASTEESVDISVVIPAYNNKEYLSRVVQALAHQKVTGAAYEVIVVDDGSSDGTSEHLLHLIKKQCAPKNFTLLYYPRAKERKMGDFQFRAGRARSIGVKYAKGGVLAFLDSDILIPPNYIQHLHELHAEHGHDVVQVQRLYLKKEASRSLQSYGAINGRKDVFHPEGGYWRAFFEDSRAWPEIPNYWKYACTYGLSVRTSFYQKVGGFRRAFNSYGFEDTELGYRLVKAGARFFKSPLQTYHLWHDSDRSEFKNSFWRRRQLLGRSANIFFRHHLDLEIFEELETLLREY